MLLPNQSDEIMTRCETCNAAIWVVGTDRSGWVCASCDEEEQRDDSAEVSQPTEDPGGCLWGSVTAGPDDALRQSASEVRV